MRASVLLAILIVTAVVGALFFAFGSPAAWILWSYDIVVIGAWVVNTIRFLRQARRYRAQAMDGFAAMNRGEFATAREAFTAWSESQFPNFRGLSQHVLAWTMVREGQLAEAIALQTNNIERHEATLRRTHMLATAITDLGFFHVLKGDLEEAQAVLDKVQGERSNTSLAANTAFARATLLCRREQCAAAATLLDERWAEYEAAVVGSALRLMRIVRAFAKTAAGPREAGLVDAALASMRPAYPGEFAFLGAAWPEMAAFLVTHQLA